jgi:hypothetical protein
LKKEQEPIKDPLDMNIAEIIDLKQERTKRKSKLDDKTKEKTNGSLIPGIIADKKSEYNAMSTKTRNSENSK